jgi:hypothetical protein
MSLPLSFAERRLGMGRAGGRGASRERLNSADGLCEQWAVAAGSVALVTAFVEHDYWLLAQKTADNSTCLHVAVREHRAEVWPSPAPRTRRPERRGKHDARVARLSGGMRVCVCVGAFADFAGFANSGPKVHAVASL